MNQLPEKFKNLFETNDIENMKLEIRSYIDKNPTNTNYELKNIMDFLDNNKPDIWESTLDFNKEEFQEDWNIKYVVYLQNKLRHNFSKDIINHILLVGGYVSTKYSKSKMIHKKKQDSINKKKQHSKEVKKETNNIQIECSLNDITYNDKKDGLHKEHNNKRK